MKNSKKRLNKKSTKEMYIYNDILMEEFENYEIIDDKKYEYKIEKEKTKQIQIME